MAKGSVKKGDFDYLRKKSEDVDLFTDKEGINSEITPLTFRQYQEMIAYPEKKNRPAILPMPTGRQSVIPLNFLIR